MDTSLIWEKVNGQGLVNFRNLMDSHFNFLYPQNNNPLSPSKNKSYVPWTKPLWHWVNGQFLEGMQILFTAGSQFRGRLSKFPKHFMDKFVDRTSQIWAKINGQD